MELGWRLAFPVMQGAASDDARVISDAGSARVSSPVQGVEIASAGAQGATC